MSVAAKHLLNKTLFSYCGFLLFLVLGQWMTHQVNSTYWVYMSILTFNLLFTGVWGIAIPIILSRQFEFKLFESVHPLRLVNGVILLLLILYQVFFRRGLANALFTESFDILIICKYVLFLFPLSIGIMLQCFFLIPKTIQRISDPKTSPTSVQAAMILASGASLGFVFYAFSLFSSPQTGAAMFLLGLVIGTVTVLTGSVYYAFPVFFAVSVVHAATGANYLFEPAWGPVVFGIISAVVAFIIPFRYYRLDEQEA